jgi:tagatose-6-phosphate ketose/aldose isomerase
MDALSALLNLTIDQRSARGLSFTAAEIFQQPATWQSTRDDVRRNESELRTALRQIGIGSNGVLRPTVRLIGAGTSDYVARSVRAVLANQWRCDVNALPSTDLLTNQQEWIVDGQRYIYMWFSRSGNSPESIAILERTILDNPSIHHLVITCNREGQLASAGRIHRRVKSIVLDETVNDRGLAMTSSFSNMVIAAQVVAHIETPHSYDAIFDEIVRAAASFRAPAADLCASLAQGGYSQVCFLGTGTLNAVAQECALKVLELTAGRVHTIAQSSLGIRHGPLSALNRETLVISFLSGDCQRRNYETDLLSEIRSKNLAGTTVAITPMDCAPVDALVDHVVRLETQDCRDEYRAPIDVMFGQLLGLFLSLEYGLKPDNPSPNGAISRVVSGVRIHRQ